MTFWKKENIFYVFAIVTALGIVYSPCLFFKYIYHDEITLLIKHRQPFFLHPNFFTEIQIGRPGNAVLVTVYDWFLNSIRDIQATRWICLLELSICAWLCMKLFQKLFNDRIIAFLAAITLFTLPPFQVFISYSGNVAWHTALFLAMLTAAVLYHRLENHPDESIGQFLKRRAFLPVTLFFITLLTYPAIAMFYWAILALILLGQSFEQQKRSAAIFTTIGFLCFSLYAVMLVIFKIVFQTKGSGIYNPYHFCADIPEKISWFIHAPLTNALNLHSIYPQSWVAVSWAVFMIFGAIIFRVKTKPSSEKTAFYSSFFASALVLSFLPNLFAKANVAFYRCSAGLSALILIAIIWAIHSWIIVFPEKIRPRVCFLAFVILCFIGTQQAFSNVLNHRALPSVLEVSEIEIVTRYLNLDRFNHVHILRPLPSAKDRYDEFGTLTDSFFNNVVLFFLCVTEENGQAPQNFDLTTHFIRNYDDPDGLMEDAMAAKRVHVYLENGKIMLKIIFPENIPDNEIVVNLQTINH